MNRKNIPVLKTLFVKFDIMYDDYKYTLEKESYTIIIMANSNEKLYDFISGKIFRRMKKVIGHSNFKIEIKGISMV